MEFKGFNLDKFQEDAVNAVNEGKSVLVSAPTGSGKTLVADYIIDKYLKEGKRVIYTAPIKALSNQKYRDFVEEYGEENIGLVTGDIVINQHASILLMTTEVYRNMAIIKDPMLDGVVYCIFDEIHYINDFERGYIWEESIIFSPEHMRFAFLSATIPNHREFADWIESSKEHEVIVVENDIRAVPLDIKFFDVDLGITTLERIESRKKDLDDIPDYSNEFSRHRRGKRQRIAPPDYKELVKELKARKILPCIYFIFSRIKTEDYAKRLAKNEDFLSKEEKLELSKEVAKLFKDINKTVLTLRTTIALRECLSKGVAFHHAGVLPDLKHIVEKLFAKGLIKVLFATETFGVGINMPAKTVCIDSLRKYTSEGFRYLNSKEFFQMSGRAGRRGMDKVGHSITLVHRPSADFAKIKNITDSDLLPLISQFRLSYNTVLNMINIHSEEEIDIILKMNFFTFQELGSNQGKDVLSSIKARFENKRKILKKMDYIDDNGKLTERGEFTTKIFANELDISQIFIGDFAKELDEFQILLLLAALCYEEKRDVKFFHKPSMKNVSILRSKINDHVFLKRNKNFRYLKNMAALLEPVFDGKRFPEIIKNTNMQEGDIIKLNMQIIDRIDQIRKGLNDTDDVFNNDLIKKINLIEDKIKESLEDIGMF